MSAQPPQILVDRIKHALDRIEAAATRPAKVSVADTRLPALEARHAALRHETATALAEMNLLLADGQR